MRISKHALLKAIDRTKLVPVEVPIRTKFGMTRGIRYKNPKTAINQTAKDIVSSRSDIKSVEDIEFKNKATGKVETLDQVAEAKQKAGGQQTMQQFVSQNYSIGKKGGGKQTTSNTKRQKATTLEEKVESLINESQEKLDKVKAKRIEAEKDLKNAKERGNESDINQASDALYELDIEEKIADEKLKVLEASQDEYKKEERLEFMLDFLNNDLRRTINKLIRAEADLKEAKELNDDIYMNQATRKIKRFEGEIKVDEAKREVTENILRDLKNEGKKAQDRDNNTEKRGVRKVREQYDRLDATVDSALANIAFAQEALKNGNISHTKIYLNSAKEDKAFSEQELKHFEKVVGDETTPKEEELISEYSKLDSEIKNLEKEIAKQEGGTDTPTSTSPDIDEISNDLTWVDYDSGNNTYTLEFNNGEYKATVDADEYAQAATDEGYFDDPDNIKTAIKQAMNEGTFEDARGNQVGGGESTNKPIEISQEQVGQSLDKFYATSAEKMAEYLVTDGIVEGDIGFEEDLAAVLRNKDDEGTLVLVDREKKLNKLEKELKRETNSFRAKVKADMIEKEQDEYDQLLHYYDKSTELKNQQIENGAYDYGDKAEQAANDLKDSGKISDTSMGDLVERLKSGSITLEEALSSPSLRMDAIILLKIIAGEEGIDLDDLDLN